MQPRFSVCYADEAEEFSKEIDKHSSLCAILYFNQPQKNNPPLKKEITCGPLLVMAWPLEPNVLAVSKLAQVRKL
jgi:hypothetical protein